MKTTLMIGFFLVSASVFAQLGASKDQPLSGEWKLITTSLGVPNTERLLLTISGGQITGGLYRDGEKIAVKGTVNSDNLQLEFKVVMRLLALWHAWSAASLLGMREVVKMGQTGRGRAGRLGTVHRAALEWYSVFFGCT